MMTTKPRSTGLCRRDLSAESLSYTLEKAVEIERTCIENGVMDHLYH